MLATELSRLGRDTLQVLAAINMLNKAKVSLYIMNYNIETLTLDGKVNPICLLKSEKLPRKKSINVDIMPVTRKNYNARDVSATDSYEWIRKNDCGKYLQSFPHKKVNLISGMLRISLIFCIFAPLKKENDMAEIANRNTRQVKGRFSSSQTSQTLMTMRRW